MQARQSGRWATAWRVLAAASILYFAYFAGYFTRGCYATWIPVLGFWPFAWMILAVVSMYVARIYEKFPLIVISLILTFLLFRFVLPPVSGRIIRTAWNLVLVAALVLYVIAQVATRPLGGCVP